MTFISGLAGKKPGAKYTKTINKKIYSYVGEETNCMFIEEVVANALIEKNKVYATKELQVVVTFEDKIFLISLNDADLEEENDGLDTIEYNKNEFSEEDIFEFLSDYIIEFEETIFVENKKTTKEDDNLEFRFINEKSNLDLTIDKDNIKAELLRTSGQKVKGFLKDYIYIIYPIILIILFPIFAIPEFDKQIEEKERIVTKLNVETKKLKEMEMKKFQELNGNKLKLKELEKEKNVFEDLEKMKNLLALKYRLK